MVMLWLLLGRSFRSLLFLPASLHSGDQSSHLFLPLRVAHLLFWPPSLPPPSRSAFRTLFPDITKPKMPTHHWAALCVGKCLGICDEDGTDASSEGVRPEIKKEAGKLASCLWNLTLGGVVNLVCLCRNAEQLKADMARLVAVKVDTLTQAHATKAEKGGRVLNRVTTWAMAVDDLNGKVGEFQTSMGSRMVYIKFLCLSYSAKQHLSRVQALFRERAGFTELVGPELPPAVESHLITDMPPGDPVIDPVRDRLADDEGGVVAVRDATTVGEASLLLAINNELAGPAGTAFGFEKVIWLPLSDNPSVEEVQTEISRRLGFSFSKRNLVDETSRASALNSALSELKFLLLLDDVRDPDIIQTLNTAGIPDLSPKKSKIVLATAFGEIAGSGVKWVFCAPPDGTQPWQLFEEHLSEVAKKEVNQNVGMKAIADRMVQLCGGLSPVLINVAKAVSQVDPLPDLWENIFFELESASDKFRGTDLIPRSFQLNYDSLPCDALRECFLYCCLFPEMCGIDKTQLVDYWVGEGLLDAGNPSRVIEGARQQGNLNISHLDRVFLLRASEKTVMLPESARRMAINLINGSSGGGAGKKKYVVHAGKQYLVVRDVESWSDAERVSLMQNNIHRLPNRIPQCPDLRTLLINNNPRLVIPAAAGAAAAASSSTPPPPPSIDPTPLFGLMIGLRVLDLSSTSIDQLPSDIRLLGELTYLNLSGTNISCLPQGLQGLAKLRQLDLRGTKKLEQIPYETISKLGELQALNLYDGGYYLCFSDAGECRSWECLLSALEKLGDLGVNIRSQLPLQLHLALPETCHRFLWSTRFLTVVTGPEDDTEGIVAVEEQRLDVHQFPNLEVLQLSGVSLSMVMVEGGAGPAYPLRRKLRHLHTFGECELADVERVQRLLPRLEIHHHL